MNSTVSSASAAASATGAPNQAGVLEGMIPTHYNASNPLTLFIIQASFPVPFLEKTE